MKKSLFFFLFLTVTASIFGLTAQDVLDKVKDSQNNFETQKAVYSIILSDSNKTQKTRKIDIYILISSDKGEKLPISLLRVTEPKDLQNTTVLNLSKTEQYIYLPGFKQVKRVSGSSKNESFLDTDINYSDMTLLFSSTIEQEHTSSIAWEDEKSYTIDIELTAQDSDYSKMTVGVDKKDFVIKYAEFFGKKEQIVKKMEIMDYESSGEYITYKKVLITSLENKHTTLLELVSSEYGIPITKSFFNKLSMTNPVLVYR